MQAGAAAHLGAEATDDHANRLLGVNTALLEIEQLILADLAGTGLVLHAGAGVAHLQDARNAAGREGPNLTSYPGRWLWISALSLAFENDSSTSTYISDEYGPRAPRCCQVADSNKYVCGTVLGDR